MATVYTLDIPLPFRVPVEDGIGIGTSRESVDISTRFYTQQVIRTRAGFPDEIDNWTTVRLKVSPKGEALSALLRLPTRDSQLYHVFNNSLDYVNRLIDAFLAVLDERNYLRNITVADLPLAIMIYRDEDTKGALYATRFLDTGEHLSPAKTQQVLSTLQGWEKTHEVRFQERLLASARSFLQHERFEQAIIDLQTSFELFVRNNYRLILERKRVSSGDIDRLSSGAFRNLVESHLARHLAVDLRFQGSGAMKEWHEALYVLRNAIVHQGRTGVSYKEAARAYKAYVHARNFLSECLYDKGFAERRDEIAMSGLRPSQRDPQAERAILEHLKRIGYIVDVEVQPEDR